MLLAHSLPGLDLLSLLGIRGFFGPQLSHHLQDKPGAPHYISTSSPIHSWFHCGRTLKYLKEDGVYLVHDLAHLQNQSPNCNKHVAVAQRVTHVQRKHTSKDTVLRLMNAGQRGIKKTEREEKQSKAKKVVLALLAMFYC